MVLNAEEYLLLFFGAFAVTGGITPIMRLIAIKFAILDSPTQSHKTHIKPIPYLGGVGIVLATITVTFTALTFSNASEEVLQLFLSIILPALIMAVVGLFDDIRELSAMPRFILQNLIALLSALFLISTKTLGTPTGIVVIDLTITVLWIVAITNAVNFFDNIDGGASGSIAITSCVLTILAVLNGQYMIAAMSIVLAGSSLGFLVWNKPPARIYMGDAGSLFLGTLISVLAIRLDSPSGNLAVGFSVLFFILAVPILDICIVFFDRIRRRKSPFMGGRDHLSHRLTLIGKDRKQAVVLLWLLSGLFSILAMLTFSQKPIIGITSQILGYFLFSLSFLFFWRVRVAN